MNNSNKWMPQPQMSMPPLGFGVVRPQPIRATGISNYGMPAEVPNSHTSINLTENSFSQWQYHSNMTQMPQQQQQQQFLMAQQKALEEQKMLYEKIMKQKQFNEQKQRLKEFGSRSKKTTVSADDMIQNIFEKQEQSAKNKHVKAYRGSSQSVSENIPKPNYFCTPQPPFLDQNHYHGLPQGQLPTNDGGVPNLLPVEKGKDASDPSSLKNTYAVNSLPSDQNFPYQGYTSLSNKSIKNATPETVSGMNTIQFTSNTDTSSPLVGTSESVMNQATEIIPLELPYWLKDSSKLPELYSIAAGLVQTSDKEWIDTSRAYMLLMQTGVPPQYLGILWEMVNQSKPGQLKKSEFYALLALVACVQKGKTVRNADILRTLHEPVYPVINHPVLLPLAEETPPSPVNEVLSTAPANADSQHSIPQNITTISESDKKLSESTVIESLPDGDDFDDFVSAPVSSLKEDSSIPNFATFPPPLSSSKTIQFPPVNTNNAHQRTHETVKSNPVKNLPTLGNSPINYPKLNDPVEFSDDDFNDFQSAPSSGVISTAQNTDNSSSIKADKKQADDGADRYAVLRDLVNFENKQSDCSLGEEESVVTTTNQEIRNDLAPKPFEDNKCVKTHSSHLNDIDGADCFADFVSKTIPQNFTDVSSESSTYITANASAETSNDDEDDFGDFVGPAAIDGINYHTKPVFQTVDIKSETQSVASLELPGLELTVNLGQSTAYNGSSKTDGLVSSSCISELELDHQLQTLELNQSQQIKEPITKDSIYEIDEGLSLEIESQEEKYKTFSEFETQIERNPRIELWEKCLDGCKKLLEEGEAIASNLQEHSSVMEFVLATSQLKDYLKNLEEVWKVSQRIEAANNCGGQYSVITDLSFSINKIWLSVCRTLGKQIDDVNYSNDLEKFNDKKGLEDSNSCSLCLTTNASLSYGGRFYHPQCANLWVNVVDSSLPSIPSSKTGLLNSKPTLL